ncbi:MAG: recombinase RecA [Dictyoglomaceae bacterium]
MEREKSLESAISQIEKQFGKGSIMRLGSTERFQVAVIPTGILTLDYALGVGGVPRGRIIELYGPEGSGKTTVALQIIASAQKRGGVAAFIDAEHALDPNYARKLGVNLENLLISQPDTGEQALEIAEILVRSGAVDVIVIDSVAALVPRAELEGEMGDAFIGLQARLMSQALRKLTGVISKSQTVAIFINQIREKVGVFFGNPETTPGGRALKFYASVRIEVRKAETMKEGSEVTGTRVKVKVVKNKVAPPFKEGEFELIYGEGISREGCILDAGVDTKVIEKSGTWYIYKDIRLGQGRENAKSYLKDHPEIADEIERQIRKIWGLEEEISLEEKEVSEEKTAKKAVSN